MSFNAATARVRERAPEIVALRERGGSWPDIQRWLEEQELSASKPVLQKIVAHAGKDIGGRTAMEMRGSRTRARVAKAIRLRRRGETYQAIGDAMGVSKERVRQLLNRSRHGARISGYQRKPPGKCVICGKPTKLRKLPTCSPECRKELSRRNWLDRNGAFCQRLLVARRSGLTWEMVWSTLGKKSSQTLHPGTLALRWVKEYAARSGEDISDCLPRGGYKRTPRPPRTIEDCARVVVHRRAGMTWVASYEAVFGKGLKAPEQAAVYCAKKLAAVTGEDVSDCFHRSKKPHRLTARHVQRMRTRMAGALTAGLTGEAQFLARKISEDLEKLAKEMAA